MKNWLLTHKKISIAGAGLLLVLALALGIYLVQQNRVPEATIEPEINQTKEINAWGEVTYTRIEDISIDFPAMVTDLLVKEGDRVALNQPLVTLDLTEYNGILEKLQQQLTVNEAALPAVAQATAALEADIVQSQNEITRKTTEYNNGTGPDLQLAQVQLDAAKRNLSNYEALYNAGGVSKEALNQCIDALKQAEETFQKTKSALKDEIDQRNIALQSKKEQLAQIKLGNTMNVTKQKGGISAAQIDLNTMTAKAARSYIKGNQIVSDIENGIVQNIRVSNAVHLGAQNMPTQVLQVIDADSMVVIAEVEEDFIGSVTLGKTVRLVPTADTKLSLTGTITQIPAIAVEKNGKRIVRVQVKPEDPNHFLKPGYTVDVYINKER